MDTMSVLQMMAIIIPLGLIATVVGIRLENRHRHRRK
ncbi:hypothetical protein BH11ARM2_BH11ARM2_00600 [soil metagenome]